MVVDVGLVGLLVGGLLVVVVVVVVVGLLVVVVVVEVDVLDLEGLPTGM